MSVVAGGVSSQAGLASIQAHPRPTAGDWEQMLADEQARKDAEAAS